VSLQDDDKTAEGGSDAFLASLGERVRELRARRGMTRRTLSSESGVSERYLAQLEGGTANPSILVLRELAAAFGSDLESLVGERSKLQHVESLVAAIRGLSPDQVSAVRSYVRTVKSEAEPMARRRRVALIGLRGGGKTTLGARLAAELNVPFIELDREIEREAGFTLSSIFDLSGQAGYRRHERACLERLIQSESPFILATGGSIVSESATFERLLTAFFTVWISASPAEHMARVVAQGDMRPMAGNREAMSDLERILAGRDELYHRADVELSTMGKSVKDSLAELRALVPAELTQS
jgi:XRE family transcriptional regulator, aerobic/anaerobic benzoate catabolism transcriptional regulator